MYKRILTLLIVLFAIVSIVGVSASEDLMTSDFDGNFKMDIPNGSNVTSDVGGLNQSFYVVQMVDFTSFAVEYYNGSMVDNSDNITDYVLNEVYKNCNKTTEGNVTSWNMDVPNMGNNNVYSVSSQNDSEVVVVIGSDIRLPDCVSSISFE
jgi:hypothetical protein